MRLRPIRHVTALLGFAVLGSCADAPTAPSTLETAPVDSSSLFGYFLRPLYCPTSTTETTTAVLDGAGGVLSVGGTTVQVPLGALLGPTRLTLTVPASNYMEIDVSAEGTDHFVFELPISVTVSYARCQLSFFQRLLPFDVWHWDPETQRPLELMPSVDDKATRSITFTTPHLSGYIIAN